MANKKESNVIDMFAWKKKELSEVETKPSDKTSFDFDSIIKSNEDNKKRIKEEKVKENKTVKRDYRLKDNDPNNKRR